MPDRPTRNDFNPTGARFIVENGGRIGYHVYLIYRWDPPGGYNPVVECRGMQNVPAHQQANELAAWYNERYPLDPT